MQTNAVSRLRWHGWCTEQPRLGRDGRKRARAGGKLDPGDLDTAGQRHCIRSTKIVSHHDAWEWVYDSCPKCSAACLGIWWKHLSSSICNATCRKPGCFRTRSSLVCCKLVIQQYRLKTREANWKWSCLYQSKKKSFEMFFLDPTLPCRPKTPW